MGEFLFTERSTLLSLTILLETLLIPMLQYKFFKVF